MTGDQLFAKRKHKLYQAQVKVILMGNFGMRYVSSMRNREQWRLVVKEAKAHPWL
jgi:hypothetical protein